MEFVRDRYSLYCGRLTILFDWICLVQKIELRFKTLSFRDRKMAQILEPGDTISIDSTSDKIMLGPGLVKVAGEDHAIFAQKSGVLREQSGSRFWLDSYSKRVWDQNLQWAIIYLVLSYDA